MSIQFYTHSLLIHVGDFSCPSSGIFSCFLLVLVTFFFFYSKFFKYIIIRSRIMLQKAHQYNNLFLSQYNQGVDIIESLQVLNILLLQKCRNYYCSCFKEKQFAVELWLLLSVLSFYRKAWGLKINLSSTSRPGLSKLLSLLNESSENLTLRVTQGAGVHSNHF